MAQVTAIGLDGEVAKVVKATWKRGVLTVLNTFALSAAEFEEYLAKEKADDFIVVCNFRELYQHILLLPPVEPKLLDPLIRAEIKKKHPDLEDFSYHYRLIGETYHEGNPVKKVSCFVFRNDVLSSIIGRFTSRNKSIKYLYNSPDTLSRLVQSYEDTPNEALLCVADSATHKTIFILENKELYFVRHIPSSGIGFDEPDAQNITMTVDYCFQSLRIRPSRAILLNSNSVLENSPLGVALAITGLPPPPSVVAPEGVVWEYAAPISALMNLGKPEQGNLLPPSYRNYRRQRRLLSRGIALLIVLDLLGAGFVAAKSMSVFRIEESIRSLRGEIQAMDSIRAAYTSATSEFAAIAPQVTYINTVNASPDVQKALVALDCLRMQDVRVKSIALTREDDCLRLHITGGIMAPSFARMQSAFERLLSSLGETKGVEIVTKALKPDDKTYSIEARYRP